MGKNTKTYDKILRLAVLFLCCLFAGSLSGCGERANGILTEKYTAEDFSLGELSWEQDFGWIYCAYAEKAAKEPEKIMQACTDGEATWKAEGCFAADRRMQTPAQVEVMRSSMSQEALLTHINTLSEKLFLCNMSVNCVIAGDVAITQLIRVDAGEEHWLYLQQGEAVYALYGFMAEESWQAFLEDWLFESELKWDGETVCGNRSELPAGGGGEEEPELCKYFLYDEFRIYLADSRVLSCQHDEEGFSLKLERDKEEEGDEKGTEVCEFWMQAGVSLPDCGTEADYLSYFEENYPTMSYYRVDLKSWKPGEKADYDDVWRQIEDSEGKYAFFYRDGIPCAAGILGEDFIGAVGKLKRQSDYDMDYGYWQREENGDIYCKDALGGFFEYIEQEVNGERLIITIQDIDDREDRKDEEIFDYMEVSVRKEGEEEPLQVFYIWKCASPDAWPSYFEDINADGYQDLIVVNTFAAANLNAATFLWLPSEGRFSEDTGVLDFYSDYYVDAVNRRIHVHTHGSAITGSWDTYQWTGESGLERIKFFSHVEGFGNTVEVQVSRYENGREEVWMDCAYDMEGFDELYEDIYNSYEWDCVWEQEVTNKETGEKFTLRYLEIRSWDDAYGGYYYDGGLFVYDEDIRLTYVSYSDFISRLSNVTMGNLRDYFPDIMEYDEEGLILHYEGGGEWGIPWEGPINE
ncbi:MAG: hypothetical protein HDR08_05120 [Lachnospiraceae bacterium]|nr:hypothetical protein [Lachnospiraceae bacterium]